MDAVLAGVVVVLGAHAAYSLYSTVRGLGAIVTVPERASEREHWPKVSIITAACNEAEGVEAATRAKLSSDYPNLEVVLVDDRSSDGTSEIADRLAKEDPRLSVVHVKELPSGWLGKVHAMESGRRVATGEWLLMSDADVHMDPDLLRRVMDEALRRELDFVAMPGQLLPSSFWLDAIFASFLRMLVVGGRLWKVGDPRSRVSVGGGVFNLVEKSAFERSPGFEHLRMEIADDVSLGQMMKRAGARSAVFHGGTSLRLYFYRTVREMMRGIEKNGYAVFGGLNPVRFALTAAVICFFELGPLALLLVPSLGVRLAGAAMLVGLALCQSLIAKKLNRPVASAVVPCVGALSLTLFAFRSAVLTHWRGGVVWRGTLYPLGELRKGRRLEIF